MKIDADFYQKNGLEPLLNQVITATNVQQFVNSLFQSFPKNEFWRFFVDGVKQKKDSWVGFEQREPGYLQAMFNVMFTMLNDINEPLNVKMLLSYHKLATENVHIKKLDEKLRGTWRIADVNFALVDTNVTLEGVLTLLSRLDEGDTHFMLARDGVACLDEIELSNYDIINSHTFKYMFDQKMEFIVRRYQKDPNDPQTKKIVMNQLADFIVKNNYFFRTQHEKIYVMDDDGQSVKIIPPETPLTEVVPIKATQILARYHKLKDLHQKTEQKLLLIAQTIQDLEQLHPFKDANCRVFVMVILNKLLIENGFPPCMLFDPNCFDAFSPSQLVDEIKKGMLTFQQIIQKNNIKTIDESKIDPALLDYFTELHSKLEQRLPTLFLLENHKSMTATFEQKLASSPKNSLFPSLTITTLGGHSLKNAENTPVNLRVSGFNLI